MGVLEGDSMSIRAEPVNLRVMFVGRAVVALDLEKKVLHFLERTAIDGGSEFFDNARDLWRSPSHEARDKVRVAL